MFASLTHAMLSCLSQTAVIKSIPEAIVVCPCLYVLAMLVMIAYIPYHNEGSDKEEEEEEEEEAEHQDNAKEEKEDVKKENSLCYEPVSSPNPSPLNTSPMQTPVARHSINLKVSVTCSYTARLNGRQPFQKTLRDFNHWYDLTYPKTISDANHTAKPMPAVKEEEQEEEEEEPELLAVINQTMDADNDHMYIDYEYMDVDDDACMSLDDDPMDVVDDMDIDDSLFSAPNNQTTQEVCKPVPMDIDSSELPSRAQSPPRPSSTIQIREPKNRPPPPSRGVPIAVPPRDRDNPSITRPAAEPTKAITTTTTTTTAATTTTITTTADSNVPKDDPPTSSPTATVTTTPHSAPSTSNQRPLSMVQRAALNKLRQNADKKIREKMKNRS